jgi:cyclin H
MLVAAYADLS